MWDVKVTIAYVLIEGCMAFALPSNPSIIIVGSGPSGIAAATKLLKNNFTDIKILEAENRIGGRINSVKFRDSYVDLGAEFCHGQEGNIVYSMAKDLNILEHSNEAIRFYRSNGEEINEKTGQKILEFAESLYASNEIKEGCENLVSIGECLAIQAKEFPSTGEDANEKEILSEAYDFAQGFLASYDSSLNLDDLAITTEQKLCQGDFYMTWKGVGYKAILEIMMQKYPHKENRLPIDDKIFLKKVVNNISNWKNGNRVTVTTTEGSTYKANHVIFTPSVGVLKANYEHLFSPPLPDEKIDAIKNIGFGAIGKVILHFPERWWSQDATWAFIWTTEDKEKLKEKDLVWLVNINAMAPAANNPNVLVAWYAGKYVPLLESLPEDKIWEGHKYLINKFLAPHCNVAMPDDLIRTKWYSNPNFRGTYSYESVKGHPTRGRHFQEKLGSPLTSTDNTPRVLFAGEATHPYHFSTVHGAIESGYREADRLIQLYKN